MGIQAPLVQTAPPSIAIGALTVSWLVMGWFACIAVIGIIAGTYGLAHVFEQRYIVSDAPTSVPALASWSPLIVELMPTPRTLKRFIYQVRLLAHLAGEEIPTSTAVALLALRKLDREILDGDDIDERLRDFLDKHRDTPLHRFITEALNAHRETFGWPPPIDHIRQFRKWMARLPTE
jgi:hypothetical protein